MIDRHHRTATCSWVTDGFVLDTLVGQARIQGEGRFKAIDAKGMSP